MVIFLGVLNSLSIRLRLLVINLYEDISSFNGLCQTKQ